MTTRDHGIRRAPRRARGRYWSVDADRPRDRRDSSSSRCGSGSTSGRRETTRTDSTPAVRRGRAQRCVRPSRPRSTACPARPPTPRSPTGPTTWPRARALTVAMVAALRGAAEAVTDETDRKLLDLWFADWDAYVRDRETYVERLRAAARRRRPHRTRLYPDRAFVGWHLHPNDRRIRRGQRDDGVRGSAHI